MSAVPGLNVRFRDALSKALRSVGLRTLQKFTAPASRTARHRPGQLLARITDMATDRAYIDVQPHGYFPVLVTGRVQADDSLAHFRQFADGLPDELELIDHDLDQVGSLFTGRPTIRA